MRKDLQLYGKIQARRKALGLSQEELAQRMGVSRQSVTKWEAGLSAPDLDRLVELADTLEVSLDFLLRDQVDRAENSADTEERGSCDEVEGCPAGIAAKEKGAGPAAVSGAPCSGRHIAFAAGLLVFLIGAGGFLTMWIWSELFPVQFMARDGTLHTGLWEFVVSRELQALFWAALAAMAAGAVLTILSLKYRPK